MRCFEVQPALINGNCQLHVNKSQLAEPQKFGGFNQLFNDLFLSQNVAGQFLSITYTQPRSKGLS